MEEDFKMKKTITRNNMQVWGIISLVFSFVLMNVVLNSTSCKAAEKMTIVVNDFDASGYAYGIERVVPDMVVSELVSTRLFAVLEKKKFDEIKREQADCLTGVYDKKNCPQVGKALGAELQLNGVVTEVGVEQKDLNVGGLFPNSDFANVNHRTVTARVKIDVRIVDGTTRATILTASGIGIETDEDWSGKGNFNGLLSHIDIHDQEWQQSFIGKAVRKAIQDIVRQIVMKIGVAGLGGKEGAVTAVSGNYVYINMGASQGIDKGTKMVVSKKKDVYNTQGALVYKGKESVAVIEITDVQESAAQGKIIERIEAVKEGYIVEVKE